MRSRILVSVVGVPVLLYVVLLAPEWVMAVALAILSGIAAGEMMECVGLLQNSRFLSRITVYAAVWTPLCAAFLPQWRGLSLLVYYLLAFAVARTCGKPLLHLLFSEKTIEKYRHWTEERDRFAKLFALAIFFPVAPDDFLCYLAGTTEMSWRKYTAIILLGKPFAIALYSLGLTAVWNLIVH